VIIQVPSAIVEETDMVAVEVTEDTPGVIETVLGLTDTEIAEYGEDVDNDTV
jgi:hypothetical protein